ncbi:MAG: clan AA aspartic protease [Gemmatimonadetes bacterium]|nr:clan AA aspartic protease [Gemmatimonadota bacterium]
MGTTYVNVTIRNPAEPHRSWTGKFLVDSGAYDSLVPKEHLEEIGLKPRGSRDYFLADGKPLTLEATVAEIEFEGVIVGGTIAFGPEGTEPLLGVTALESGGFEIDTRNERLKRLPGVMMKRKQARRKAA